MVRKYRTSWRCPIRVLSGTIHGVRTSLWRICLSLDPELKTSPFQARAPTLAEWPSRTQILFEQVTSHTWTNPLWVPTATWLPWQKKVLYNANYCHGVCTYVNRRYKKVPDIASLFLYYDIRGFWTKVTPEFFKLLLCLSLLHLRLGNVRVVMQG